AQKALQLDDSLAEAHAALARVAAYYDWEWANADREFKRAIDLQPNDPDVYHSYSRYLAATGRVDEALENVRHAQQLDPAPLIFKANEAITLYFARQYGLAVLRPYGPIRERSRWRVSLDRPPPVWEGYARASNAPCPGVDGIVSKRVNV